MTTKNSDGPEYVTCTCCRLPQPKAVDRVTGVSVRVCARCTHHQGTQDTKRLQKAESHETMLRERLEACRKDVAKSRGDVQKVQADVETARTAAGEARSATAAALRSRGRLAARIVDASGPGELQAIARDSQVIQWANAADQDNEPEFPFSR